jgi:double-stranded uracil-DNA glycosylase
MAYDSKPAWAHLRLADAIRPGVRVILVGINPGVLSAASGHHFAGPTNRFWGLLYEAGIVPQPITHEDDVRLPEWGIGMTNLIARPSPGIDDLSPSEYLEGWKILEKKIERFRPEIVAFVGVTMYRTLWKVINCGEPASPKPKGGGGAPVIKPGFQKATVHGARLFVLPNPSGRNAHFSYDDMLRAFRSLARAMRTLPSWPAEAQRRRRPSRPSLKTRASRAGK